MSPRFVYLVAMALALSGASGCKTSDTADAKALDGGGPRSGPPRLDVVPVVSQKLETSARLPGELAAYQVVAIYARVTGFVERIPVDRGSRVKRGQLLARISAPELSSQRAEAQAKAVAEKETFEHLRAAAITPGAVAKHEVEVARAAMKAADARVRSLREMEAYLDLRAPFDGLVTERNVHPGALVGPPAGSGATPLLRVEQVATLRLVVAVPEASAGTIVEGLKTEFTGSAWPGETFTGIIRRNSHSVDARTRTLPVELDVDNRAGKLSPGMFVDVKWPVRRPGPSLFVPASAIAQTTERTFVDRVRDARIEQVPVRRGITIGDRVEIFGALAADDLILKRGSEDMKDGTRVETKRWIPDGGAPGK